MTSWIYNLLNFKAEEQQQESFDIKVFAMAASVHVLLIQAITWSHDSQKDQILLQRFNKAQETFPLKKTSWKHEAIRIMQLSSLAKCSR